MRWSAAGLLWMALLPLAPPVIAQYQPPSEKLAISAKSAYTWSRAGTDVILLQGPVTITLDRATLKANQAVVWLTAAPSGAPGEQRAEFALLGAAELRQEQIGTRSGDRLLVTAQVQGEPTITADERVARDLSGSAIYRQAEAFRRQTTAPTTLTSASTRPIPIGPSSRAATGPATRPAEAGIPVHLEAGQTDVIETEEGTVALAAWNGVKIFARQSSGDTIELQAQRGVLYTALESLHDVSRQQKKERGAQKVTAVYLEGDARIEYLPTKPGSGEQRLLAERVYYEFATDRAILLNAVMHTVDPARQVPFIVRAKTLRQLSKGEYEAKTVQLTSSAFAVPSYSIAADRLYVRAEATGDPQFPQVINYEGTSATFRAFDVPFFYLPVIAGSVGDRPGAMRDIAIGHRSDQGYSFLSQWGLFETFGQIPPRDLDAAYRVDYFSHRGPGTGLDAAWNGGFVTEPNHQPWNFLGDLRSYFIYDEGTDKDYGRLPVKPDGTGYTPRGRIIFEHEHFFPSDWEAQVRLGYTSDATFLEEWYPREFYQEGPEDISAYLKHQRDSEAFTLLVEAQPNKLITSSERSAEQFDVERLPEASYHIIGQSFADDHLTFISDNDAGGVDFQPTRATLRQQGFQLPGISPGIPALGTTGVTTSTTWRADFREELDLPITAGHFNVVPYVVGRYTEYSESVGGGDQARLFGVVGARLGTSFWKVDRNVQSDLFDVHQLRHVIEPEVNVFAAGTTVNRTRLFAYDQPIDQINNVSAVEMGLRQRWQTMRGGPGRWRSVDLFTLDVDAEFYSNKPPRKFLQPFDFRGVFFNSLPEASVPRDAVNANASWRIADNTVVLADAQYNLDESKLATAAVGVLVRRDIQQSWYVGTRYIADLNSNITSVQFQYQISPKYTVVLGQDFDVGLGQNVSTSVAIIRSFDRFILEVSGYHNQIGNTTGISFNIYPLGFGQGVGSSTLQGPFHR